MNVEGKILEKFHWKSFMGAVIAIGLVYAVIKTFNYNLLRLIDGQDVFWIHGLVYSITASIGWIVLIPFILKSAVRIYTAKSSWYKKVAQHFLLALVISPIHMLIFLSLNYPIQSTFDLWSYDFNYTYAQYLTNAFPTVVADSFLFYSIIAGLVTGYVVHLNSIRESDHKAKVEEELNESRISNLKYQLQPHFLFNSLQTISNLIHVDKELADEAVSDLSDILRLSIQQLNQKLIPLEQEIKFTEKYLAFQKLRFQNQVSYSISQSDVRNMMVPAYVLQPLVENSIKHGLEHHIQPIIIEITLEAQDKYLIIKVQDNGVGFGENYSEKKSGGLKNLDKRLSNIYQGDHKLLVENQKKGSLVIIQLPIDYGNV